MSSESVNDGPSNMSETLSSESESGHEMTNETEDYPEDDVSEVYSLEIFETVKKGLRADRRFVLHASETKQCLQAILTFVEAERLSHEELHPSREFLTQVFPLLWRSVLRQEPTENLLPEFVAWGRLLAKIGQTLLEKATEIDFKMYPDLALRTFHCLLPFFDTETLIYRNMYFPDAPSSPQQSSNHTSTDSPDVSWPKSLAVEILENNLDIVCKLMDRFFSHQIYEDYTDPTSEDLLESILAVFSQMISVGIDKEMLSRLSDLAKASIMDIRRSPIENLSFTFLSSLNFLEYLYSIVYFAESVEAAEETVGAFRRHVLKEELKQGNFKSRLTALRCLGSYIDAVSMFDDVIPLQRLQTWMNREDIVGMMLGSHVEKVHYAEHVLGVLERMVKTNIFETDHIDALWSLIEPDGVFEGLRDNVVQMTIALTKKMSLDHVRYVIGKGTGSCGFISKNFRILHAILQREDTSIDCVEPLLKLYWDVLKEMAKIDDSGKTINFKDCIQMYFHRGCYDLPEKYLKESVEILQNGQISITMVQVFSELYALARKCYPSKQLCVDPHDLLVSTLERYHSLMANAKSRSPATVDICMCRRIIAHILCTIQAPHRPLTLDLLCRIWDVCVLNPLHEDVREDTLGWFLEKMEYVSPFLSDSTLSDFLHDRICQLNVAEMDRPAFDCFRECFTKPLSFFHESVVEHPAMEYLWKIFLNTEISGVVLNSKSLIIKIYLHFERLNDFLKTLMTSLLEGLTNLAHAESGWGCTDVIEKLCAEKTEIEGVYGMHIHRCVDALVMALTQAATEKQFAIVSTLKNMLSRSEKMNKILVFLADSFCPSLLREGVYVILDSVPVYQPLLAALNRIMKNTPPAQMTERIEEQLFPAKTSRHTVEQTRYALTALIGVLRCAVSTRDDFEELGCLCLLYILDCVARVDLSDKHPDEIPTAQQRLHTIGVEIVGQIMCQLKIRTSTTNSAESSPQGEEMKPTHLFTTLGTAEEHRIEELGDAMIVSESSRDLGSDVMDFSIAKPPICEQPLDRELRRGNASQEAKMHDNRRNAESHRSESASQSETDQRNAKEMGPVSMLESSAVDSPQESELQGCMSVDSITGTSLTQKPAEDKGTSMQVSGVMGRVIEYLVEVIVEASHAWTPSAEPASMDVQLIEMSVDQLIKIIEQWSLALDLLLAAPGIVEILMRNILNPLPKIRLAFWRLATTICSKSESAANSLYKWAREHREQADQVSVHCTEFYLLVEQLIQLRLKHPSPDQIDDVRKLMDELIQCITDAPYEEEVEGMKLCQQLQLLIKLLTLLGSDARSGIAEGDLILFLIKEILFPEAVSLRKAQAQNEPLQIEAVLEIMKTKSNPDCARHEAFDLLLRLMRNSSLNHRLALECLNELHFGVDAAVREVAGSNATRSSIGYVGLQNGGATCYINSVIQQLFMQPAVRDTVLAATRDTKAEEYGRTPFNALQKVFGYLQASSRRCYYPREFLESFTHSDGSRIDVRQHHDALEFFQRTQELVDEHLVRHGMKPIIKNVVGTTHVQQIICKDNDQTYISASEQTYTSCSLDIVGKTTLHESLEAYVQGELLEGSDAYHCEPIGKKVPALKRLCLKTPPMTLVLQLKRFEMDYQLMETYKNNDRFEFPLELNIFPYTASGLMQNEGLAEHNGGDHSPKLNPAQCHYHLKGIVVHTGEIDGGHYYSFIKERPSEHRSPKQCRWWRFDDSFVEVWDTGRLDEDCYGGTTGLDVHDTQRIPKLNNAYILIYEHVPATASEDSSSSVASQSQDLAPMPPTTAVPTHIEREVLNDNLVLLSACRLAERNYMYFILKLLKTMPSKDDLNRRKMRRVTPCGSRGDSNCDSSSGSVASPEKSPEESCTSRGEGTDELITTVKNVASIVCEYIFKVILTPCVFLHADGIEWGEAISVIVENTIARDIALQKLTDHAENTFRCLVCQGNEAAKDFLSQFLTKLIQSLANAEEKSTQDTSSSTSLNYSLQGSVDTLDSRIIRFLMVVSDYLDHRWNFNFDVSRVLEIACLIAEVLYGHGDKASWLSLMESLLCKACRFSKIVYLQGRSQFMRSLDITNRCVVRLINSCLEEPKIDEDDETRNPMTGLDPNVIRIIEKFTSHRQLVKSLLRPTVLADRWTVRLLTLMSWENYQGILTLLDCMQDSFPEMENCDGEHFVLVVDAFLDLACARDRYYPAKLSYLLFKGNHGLTPWALIVNKIQPLLRWRLLYFLMIAFQREEKLKEELQPLRDWECVLDWMRGDSASIPSDPGEAWLDKQEIYRWAVQFEDL